MDGKPKEYIDYGNIEVCKTCKSNPHEPNCPIVDTVAVGGSPENVMATNDGSPESINEWVNYIVSWRMRKGFVTSWDNFAEKAMLIVTEVSELVEAKRHCSGVTEHSDHREYCLKNMGEEMADIIIRTFDLAGSLGFDVEAEIAKKMDKNEKRPYKHGKAF